MTTPELESVAIALWRNDDTGCDWEDQDDDERAFYISQARAALSAIREPVSDWQPIETNEPPHETLVLLYSPPCVTRPNGTMEVACASTGRTWDVPNVGRYSNMSWHGSATHWMPLPPPPKTEPTT